MNKNPEDCTKEELLEMVKHLKRQKKFGLVWEDKPEQVVEQCKRELPVLEEVPDRAVDRLDDAPTNLIIEGDNYHALSVLNYTHAGKIDVIYIDPPYNTGARDWKYNNDYVDINDSYRHSKWLSMMRKRLLLSRSLLTEEGVLICAIDDNEHAHLGVLLEELFPDREIHWITVVHNAKGVQGTNFSYTHEYAIFVIPRNKKVIADRKLRSEEVYHSNLRNWGGESLRTDARNCFYPIIVRDDQIIGFGDVCNDDFHPFGPNVIQDDGSVYVYPIDQRNIERKWRYARQSVETVIDYLRVKQMADRIEIEIGKDFAPYKTVWQDTRYDASEYGTKLLKKIVPDCNFDFPKSLYTVQDCIAAVVGSKPNAIILDYFAGSGTTGHAVMDLNKGDEGSRQFILCTNDENRIAEECTYPRIRNVIEGYANVPGIPANLRYFRTDFVPKQSVSDDTRYELTRRATDMICVREDTYEPITADLDYAIFRNAQHTTGILYDIDALARFKQCLAALADCPASLYIFSLTNDTYEEDFADLPQAHKLCPIPESILEVYRRIQERP